ncbi:MAG TPA: PilW family protein, partial [Xanthobacteraceae bacterium]
DGGAPLACLSDVKANTDVVVVRRVSTCISGTAACPAVAGAPYFQASLCNSATQLGSASVTDQYRLDSNAASLDRQKRDCATLAVSRQYLTRVYFIAQNSEPGDGIPTLKRAEIGAGGVFAIVPLAEGIEDLQLEHGIDTDNDGMPNVLTADPTSYAGCVGAACVTNWSNVVSVKVNILARSTTPSNGFTDTKSYVLGLQANGTANTVGPFNNPYRRHVFQSEVRLNNPAGRREK